jgi:hypothetical protein
LGFKTKEIIPLFDYEEALGLNQGYAIAPIALWTEIRDSEAIKTFH